MPASVTPRERGENAATACLEKAETTSSFDSASASEFILQAVRTYGPESGEVLVNRAKQAGFVPHDDRAFGAVFSRLVRRHLIECSGWSVRSKGHGTAGARIWKAIIS
jgi:hypothetical protein